MPFKLYLTQRGSKPRTIEKHLYHIQKVIDKYGEISRPVIDRHLLFEHERGIKNKTLNIYIDSYRVYGHFSGDTELQKVKYFKAVLPVKATLSDEEIEAIIQLPKLSGQRQKEYDHWSLFFSMVAWSGCRPGEIAALTKHDFDFGRKVYIIRDSKTNTPRLVPIAANIIEEVKKSYEKMNGVHFFPSLRGGKNHDKGAIIDSSDWCVNFKKRIKRLGIDRPGVSVYSLRHSYLTTLAEEDVNIKKIMKIAGHKKLETTLHYFDLTTKDLHNASNKHPYIRRATDPQEVLKAMADHIRGFQLEKDGERFEYQLQMDNSSLRLEVRLKNN